MTTYSTFALADLLDAFASNDPVPGGGSAAALAGALGVSLLLMVSGLPRTKTGTPEEAADLAEAAARLRPLREQLEQLIDGDSAAYQEVIAAYALPKQSEADMAQRRNAIREAMRRATETPLETMRVCQQALDGTAVIASNGAPSAASDVAVALELLGTAVRSAGFNVDTNLATMKDSAYIERIRGERQALEADAIAAVDRTRRLIPGRR